MNKSPLNHFSHFKDETAPLSTAAILGRVLLIIAISEVIAMYVLRLLPTMNEHVETFLDAGLLSAFSLGPLMYFVVRPYKLRSSSRAQTLSLIENCIDQYALILKTDLHGNIRYANNNFLRMSGYNLAEILAEHMSLFSGDYHDTHLHELMQTQLSAGQTIRTQLCNFKKNQETYWVDASITPLVNNQGDVTELLHICYDITQQKRAEQSTNSQKDFSEKILETMSEGYIIHDERGRLIHSNRAACDILGLSLTQLAGLESEGSKLLCIDANEQKIQTRNLPHVKSLRTRRVQRPVTLGVQQASGQITWINAHSIPFQISPDSRRAGVLTTISDISELFRDRQSLAENERQLREAQKVAQIGSWIYSVSDQHFQWTDQLYAIFSRDPKRGAPDLEEQARLILDEDWIVWKRAFDRCLETGEPFAVRIRSSSSSQSVWIDVRANALLDQEGKVKQIQGTCQDISQQIAAQQEKQLMIESLGIGIWKVDLRTQELIWDDSNYRLHGLKRSSFGSDKEALAASLTPESRFEKMKILEAAIQSKTGFDTHFEIVTSTGESRSLGVRAVTVLDLDGNPTHLYGLSRDKTLVRSMEKSLEAERAKGLQNAKLASLGEMAAGVAHEINNPLAIISASIDLLPKIVANPEKLKSRIEQIEKAISRISKIVNGLRKFSRNTAEKDLQIVSLKSIAEEAISLTGIKAKRHGVDLFVEFNSNADIRCDEVEIEQVLVNLINNSVDAIKNNQERWIKIQMFDSGTDVAITVTDSGEGIPASVLAKLYDPFFTTKKVGEGTGLGLSIVKGIVESHQGSIQVLSDRPNTCFEIRFPRIEAAHAA